jgi:hypothetical protein
MVPVIALIVVGFILIESGISKRGIGKVITGDHTPDDPTDTSWMVGIDNATTGSDLSGPVPGHHMVTGPGTPKAGLSHFDGHLVSSWIVPVLKWARKNGWSGSVTSGYRTTQQQAEAVSTFGPKAPPGQSNHNKVNYPGGAVDVSDYQTLARLVPSYPGPGPTLVSGSVIGDPLHFSSNGH